MDSEEEESALLLSIQTSMQALADRLTQGLITPEQYLHLDPLIQELISLPKIPVTSGPVDIGILWSYTDVLGRINKALLH